MALHNSIQEMLNESMNELLLSARICLDHKKDNGGCLGYPAAISLFSIVETIASAYSKRDGTGSLTVTIPDCPSPKPIKGTDDHFFILNSKYFNQNLTQPVIQDVYKYYRSRLVHNAFILKNRFLEKGKPTDSPFIIADNQSGGKYLAKINLEAFYSICESAVPVFLNDIKQPAFTAEVWDRAETDANEDKNKPLNPTSILDRMTSTGFTESVEVKVTT